MRLLESLTQQDRIFFRGGVRCDLLLESLTQHFHRFKVLAFSLTGGCVGFRETGQASAGCVLAHHTSL